MNSEVQEQVGSNCFFILIDAVDKNVWHPKARVTQRKTGSERKSFENLRVFDPEDVSKPSVVTLGVGLRLLRFPPALPCKCAWL